MSRPVHQALFKPGEVHLKYHSAASENYKKCLYCMACIRCDIFMCRNVERIWESTYVTAWENKLEVNYPDFYCCCLMDKVGVIYYDRSIIQKVEKAGCCKPACTHCSPCPTCCDVCGEGLVLYGASVCSTELAQTPGIAGLCCCRSWVMVTNITNTQALADAITTARDECKQRMAAPTAAPLG